MVFEGGGARTTAVAAVAPALASRRIVALVGAIALAATSVPTVLGITQRRLEKRSPLVAIDGEAHASHGAPLTQDELDAAVASAIADWRAVDDSDALDQVNAHVASLPNGELGEADGTTIAIDDDAAGHGWGRGGMDLGTVVRHEMGHALGFGHAFCGLMAPELAVGDVRDVPVAADLASLPRVDANGQQLLADEATTDASATDATATDATTDTATTDPAVVLDSSDTTVSDAPASDASTTSDTTVSEETSDDTTTTTADAPSDSSTESASTPDATPTTDTASDTAPAEESATADGGNGTEAAATADAAAADDPGHWNVDGATATFGDLTGSGIDLTITYDAATNVLRITSGDGTVEELDLDGITTIVINGTSGDDTLHIDAGELPDGISLVVDGGAGTDTIEGPSSDATWTVDGPGSGQVGGATFTGAENLAGADGNKDTFVFTGNGSIIGRLTGGNGGFDSIVVNSIIGQLSFSITASDSGLIGWDANSIAYSGFEPVTDTNPIGTLTINATAGNDTITIQDNATSSSFDVLFSGGGETHTITGLSLLASLVINAGGGDDAVIFQSIDSGFNGLIAIHGEAGDDSLSIPDIGGVWTITGIDRGRWLSGTSPPLVTFDGTENLVGASTAADSFEFSSG
ncbi:MAG: hypothetical protein V7636_1423, partial [Actinomycetota bacterium]